MPSRIRDKIYKIELPIPFALETVNVYYIDDSPRTLVDSGIKTEASFEALQEGLKTIGFSLQSVERILLTHGHIDHYGLAKRIASLSGARIYIHPVDYRRVRSILHSLGFLKSVLSKNGVPDSPASQAVHYIESAQSMADPLDDVSFLEDGDEIPFQSMTWRAVHCPGHSPGLLCYYWPEGGILFSGDHLLKEITPNPILNVSEDRLPLRYTSLMEYLASLEKIEKLEISLLLPAHGPEVSDVKGLINKIRLHHRDRTNLILSILSRGERTAFEIAMELFPGVSPFEIFLGVSEALGHLEILKQQGKVGLNEKEGLSYYSITSGNNFRQGEKT